MIFTYQFLNHPIEKLHLYIEHTVLSVWCEAPNLGMFNISHLHPDFQPIIKEVNYNLLHDPIKRVFTYCQALSLYQLNKIRLGFIANNSIEELCNGNLQPMHYSDIEQLDSTVLPSGKTRGKLLADELNIFFKKLYKNVLLLKPVYSRIGQINEHYDAFMEVNNKYGKCPFCGLHDLKGIYHTKREAYDHYLPKDLYPFSSVNFKNLAPVCPECNSSYKSTKDTIFHRKRKAKSDPISRKQIRRTAFYPFSGQSHKIHIKMAIKSGVIYNLTPANINLTIACELAQQEVNTWSDVFSISERYKAKFCHPDALDWLEEYRIMRDGGYNATFNDYRQGLEKRLFQNTNFLRCVYLEACLDLGIIN